MPFALKNCASVGVALVLLWCALPAQSAQTAKKATAKAYQRRYQYYLDPLRAEEILSKVEFGSRLSKDKWLGLVGKRLHEQYRISAGDSLWHISAKTLGDPKLWRKLWQENPIFSNPHEISVGQVLAFYRDELEPKPLRIPIVKIVPQRLGEISDLDADSFVTADIKNRFRPSVIVLKREDVRGEVTGAYTYAQGMMESDEVHLQLANEKDFEVGRVFAVVRDEQSVEDNTLPERPKLGRLMRLVGELKLTRQGEEKIQADVKSHYDFIRRGDLLIDPPPIVEAKAMFNPPEELRARIIMGAHPDMRLFGQGQIVVLNKGTQDGMRNGHLFRVVRDTDPFTESSEDVDPDFKGEVQIFFTSEAASVGYILRNKVPLLVGDTLLAAQLFPNPPPTKRREIQVLEID